MSSWAAIVRTAPYYGMILARDSYQLVLLPADIRDIHVVGRGTEFLELLARENVESSKMDLGVAVLSGLGGAHVDNLAGAALDDHEPVLSQRRALHGERGRGAGVGRLEGVVMLHHRRE